MGKFLDRFMQPFKESNNKEKFNPSNEKIMMMYGCFEDPTDDTKKHSLDEPNKDDNPFNPDEEIIEFLYGVFPWESDEPEQTLDDNPLGSEAEQFNPENEIEEDLYGVFPLDDGLLDEDDVPFDPSLETMTEFYACFGYPDIDESRS